MKLTIDNLSKTYPGGVQALKTVSLEIPCGMFGLLGPNGAGKTTLMRTIATLQQPDSGSICLDSVDVSQEPDRIRRVLGYLPQDFGVYPDQTAEQMLDHLAFLKGITNRKQRQESVAYLLEQTNLFEVRKRRMGGFSGGMRQRFGIAQALIGNPRLIIVDEPTAGLDPEERVRLHNILSDISEDRIVILSTHIVDDVRVLCPRFGIIRQGELLLCSPTQDAIDRLDGQVWGKTVPKGELAAYDEKYPIILSRMRGGAVQIHIRSDHPPGNGFLPVEPELDDVYFAVIRQARAASAQSGVK